MDKQVPFSSLLVPTDFSEHAWAAFEHACKLINEDDSEIVVMHAIDPTIINQVVELGIGEHDEILSSMRKNAIELMQRFKEAANEQINVDTLVGEGDPCFEIIRKAEDFAVDAIVMSKHGQRDQTKTLLFGSTAEKVIRGSKKPVIVLPT